MSGWDWIIKPPWMWWTNTTEPTAPTITTPTGATYSFGFNWSTAIGLLAVAAIAFGAYKLLK